MTYQKDHPITPPPELVSDWAHMLAMDTDTYVFTQAANWGADQELEACCEWLSQKIGSGWGLSAQLRAARRPKPPSLKEQALKELEWVDKNLKMPLLNQCTAIHTIRCALEQLDE